MSACTHAAEGGFSSCMMLEKNLMPELRQLAHDLRSTWSKAVGEAVRRVDELLNL